MIFLNQVCLKKKGLEKYCWNTRNIWLFFVCSSVTLLFDIKTFPNFVKNNEGNAVNLNIFIKIGCTIACKINKNGLTSNVSFNWYFMVNINFLDFCDSPFLDIYFFDFSFFWESSLSTQQMLLVQAWGVFMF